MDGQFLSDLSEGIFERLGSLRKEQEAKDEERKQDTLRLLTGLAPQIEPESLPLLMGHIGDVIGIKGKMRKFWDAFSGMPDRTIEDQIGTNLRDLSSQLVGPETARKARAGGSMARLFQPQTPEQQANQANRLQAERDLSNRIVLRDPRREKLEEIEQRYSTQLANNLYLKDIQHRNELNKLDETYRLKGVQDQVRYNQKIFRLRDEVAESFLGSRRAKTLNEAKDMADTYLADKREEDLDAIRAQIDLRKALTGKAETESRVMKETGGLTKSQEINVEDRRREAANRVKREHEDSLRDLTKARKKMSDISSQITGELERGKSTAKFDPSTGSVVPAPGDQMGWALGLRYKSQLEEYRKAASDAAGAEEVAKGRWGTLRMPPYNKYYKVGATHTDPIEEVVPSEKKAIPPTRPTPPSRGDVSRVGIGTTKGVVTIPTVTPGTYEVGGRVKYGGKWYRITGITGNFLKAIPE